MILKNATYIDWKKLNFKQTHIEVGEGPEGGIRFIKRIPKDSEKVIDCAGKLVTKSFVNGHHHVYSALARGMNPPKKIPENFTEVLEYVWWTLDKSLDKDMIEASALVTAIDCAKKGVTFVIDHHASPFAVENSMEIIAGAFERVGVSHLLCYELSDRDGKNVAKAGINETENYMRSGRQGLVGLHASFTVSNQLLEKAVQIADKFQSGIHVHVAEDPIDQQKCMEDYGISVIERYKRAGVLNFKKTILAHCLHLSPEGRKIVADSPVYVAQNADSNLNNNVGVFNGKGLGDRIMLGTDGMHSDMIRSARTAYLAGQSVEGVSPDSVYQRFRNAHYYLKDNNFIGDGDNNLVILDYKTPTEITENNFLSHFIYGFDAVYIESVISGGRLIVENRKVLNIDEDEVLKHSRELGKKLWKKMSK